jgi:hypothetical protein
MSLSGYKRKPPYGGFTSASIIAILYVRIEKGNLNTVFYCLVTSPFLFSRFSYRARG